MNDSNGWTGSGYLYLMYSPSKTNWAELDDRPAGYDLAIFAWSDQLRDG